MPDIYLLTTATQPNHRGFKNWKVSVAEAGWKQTAVHVVGMGQKWEGWKWRAGLIATFCASLESHTTVVITDAYDLLVFGGPVEFKRIFESQRCDILFGVDYACIKHTDLMVTKSCMGSVDEKRNIFINGGGLMGTAGALESAYKYICDNHQDDQIGWFHYITGSQYPPNTKFAYDDQNRMFFNMMFGPHLVRDERQVDTYIHFIRTLFQPSRTTNTIRLDGSRPSLQNGVRPLIIHTPGLTADNGARYNFIGSQFLAPKFVQEGSTFRSLNLTVRRVLIVALVLVLLTAIILLTIA
jgi:hypothetical protein